MVIPAFNEAANLEKLLRLILVETNKLKYRFEYIFVNDGSTDSTNEILKKISAENMGIKTINLSRNFGKEAATSAGIKASQGDACIIIDADLQHPPKYIPDFLRSWENGNDVVVGVRKSNSGEGFIKRQGSKYFHKIINRIAETKIKPGSTDFRLIDRQVIDVFNQLSEHNRITRGLIDWMGFSRDYVYFEADKREAGVPGYSTIKLVRLAFNSFISLSLFPLRLAGYLGIIITLFSCILGLVIFTTKYVFVTPWGKSITGTAILAIILMFLIGIVLVCLGLIALYIANIYQESISRPLYIVKKDRE